jgi:Tol biopolymer transport system component
MSSQGGTATPLHTNVVDNNNPEWSPDGTSIAFESTAGRNGSWFDIWVMPSTGGPASPLTTDAHSSTPSWSPDGKQIAFSSQRSSAALDVWVMTATGEIPRNLTIDESDTSCIPAWSPDGALIAFSSNRDPDGWDRDIWVMPALGGPAIQLTSSPNRTSVPAGLRTGP